MHRTKNESVTLRRLSVKHRRLSVKYRRFSVKDVCLLNTDVCLLNSDVCLLNTDVCLVNTDFCLLNTDVCLFFWIFRPPYMASKWPVTSSFVTLAYCAIIILLIKIFLKLRKCNLQYEMCFDKLYNYMMNWPSCI